MSRKILGIELGSTRIKSVLIDENGAVLASGIFEWENTLVDGLWSYSLEDAERGVRESYSRLVKDYGEDIRNLNAIGVSAMMHGYLAFDKDGRQLVPFRTWRNTNTGEAAQKLSELFSFNVPLRWSVSQYYQSYLDKMEHVKDVAVARLTTLAGYIHYRLTGRNVLGADDASGMFPLSGSDYDGEMLAKFNKITGRDFKQLLPEVLLAGENAGTLTEEGAHFLDPTGTLKAGAICCPPEGDMGTGMVATNSVLPKTANISSGTAANCTVVLEKPLKNYYKEIDIISTPDGHPAALIHTNNCTSEINEWVNLFSEVADLCGAHTDKGQLFEKLFNKSLESDGDVGKLAEPLVQKFFHNFDNVSGLDKVSVNGEETRLNYGDLTLDKSGTYEIAITVNGKDYTFTVTVDATAPAATLTGVENGGSTKGGVTLSDLTEKATVEVYKGSEKIDYTLGSELTEVGQYRIVLTDELGNSTEYTFEILYSVNGGAIALIVIAILVAVGVIVTVVIMRKKGKFGKNTAEKKKAD